MDNTRSEYLMATTDTRRALKFSNSLIWPLTSSTCTESSSMMATSELGGYQWYKFSLMRNLQPKANL